MKECQNPKCRGTATKKVQKGEYSWREAPTVEEIKNPVSGTIKINEEIEVCARCAEDVVQNYREQNDRKLKFVRSI